MYKSDKIFYFINMIELFEIVNVCKEVFNDVCPCIEVTDTYKIPLFVWIGSTNVGYRIYDYSTCLPQHKQSIINICSRVDHTYSSWEREIVTHRVTTMLKFNVQLPDNFNVETFKNYCYELQQSVVQLSTDIKLQRKINLVKEL